MSLSRALKLTTVTIISAACLAAAFAPFAIEAAPFAVNAGIALLLWGLAYFYTHRRPDAKIATTAETVGYMTVVSACIGLISYTMVTLNRPLIDEHLAQIDAAVGIDWLAFLAFSAQYPWFTTAMELAYHSSAWQLFAAFFILSFCGQFDHLRRFLLTYAWTVFVVVIVAGLMPAIGAYIYYQPPPELQVMSAQAGIWHLEHFNALRDGSFSVFKLMEIEGLVTFPSFHTTLALLTVWAYWPIALLRWPILIVNIFVLLGTVLEGGHYVIDMVAGAALAGLAIVLVKRLRGADAETKPAKQPAEGPAFAT
ncbi:MAG: phosphatase PAP2 family protein [Pseudomonadota bacterium]